MTTATTNDAMLSDPYLTDILLLCALYREPIKARINTSQWIRVLEWIGPSGECQACWHRAKESKRISPESELVKDEF